MKRYFAFLLLFIIAFSTLTPLWGTKSAQAQTVPGTVPYAGNQPAGATDTRNPKKGVSPDMVEVFKSEKKFLETVYTLDSKAGSVIAPRTSETMATLVIELAMDEKFNGAEDEFKNGILDADDYFGGWASILDRRTSVLYNFKGDNDTGIYLLIQEGTNKNPISQGGPYYNLSKLITKVNAAFPSLKITELNRESFSREKGEFNILPFFAFLNKES